MHMKLILFTQLTLAVVHVVLTIWDDTDSYIVGGSIVNPVKLRLHSPLEYT